MEHEHYQLPKMKTATKHACKAALMLIMMLLVTSCAFNQELPRNWALPALAPAGNCPDISGQYMNLGETIENKAKVPLILELLTNEHKNNPLVKWQEVSHISVQQQGQNLLNIVAWKDNEALYSKNLSKDSNDFKCEEGWLKIMTSTLRGIGMAAEMSSTSRSFATANGYLLEKRESGSLILLAILPIVSSSTEWVRFARNEKNLPNNPQDR